MQQACNTFHYRQPEADATGHPCPLIEAMEFFEHRTLFSLRNTNTGIGDLDAQPVAAAPTADQNAPGGRVFDRV